DFAIACDELGIGHRWTRPYRPQTNGKAERLVRTLLAEWALRRAFHRASCTGRGPRPLHRLLQSTPTTLVTRRAAADQPRARQQPDGEEHLGRSGSAAAERRCPSGRRSASHRLIER